MHDPADDDARERLSARLERVEELLMYADNAASAVGDDLTRLAQRLAAIERRLASIEARLDARPDQDDAVPPDGEPTSDTPDISGG